MRKELALNGITQVANHFLHTTFFGKLTQGSNVRTSRERGGNQSK